MRLSRRTAAVTLRAVTILPTTGTLIAGAVLGTVAALLVVLAVACGAPPPSPAEGGAVEYVLRFPEPEHHWMEVEVTFPDLDPAVSLQARMSRSSPGRYALHEFAKNVFDVRAVDGAGNELEPERPDPHGWSVPGHDGTVTITYRIFGDRTDGTYLGVDTTHAHMNMPATLLWARGLEEREARVRLVAPEGADWRVASQLLPSDEPDVFTAPDLQYLMDSPTEFGETASVGFQVDDGNGPQRIRVALHHQAGPAVHQRYADDVQRIVEEMVTVYGEYPRFDGGTYTFIADYLPWASGDGMEHRNSTILTSSGSLANPGQRTGLLGTVSHEFFHAWNVERIRPVGLEPFDFERANVSDALWLAEGFTSYYGNLILHRSGVADRSRLLGTLNGYIRTASDSPGRQIRSAVQMSRLAPFVDAARPVDPTYWTNTFISYYTWGAAIALGLDLTLRQRSDGEVTLDDYMQALWERFGAPGDGGAGAEPAAESGAGPAAGPEAGPGTEPAAESGREPAKVANPYTVDDARQVLGEVAGDAAFAEDFFARYIEGHEVPDYAELLLLAGLELQSTAPGHASLGDVLVDFRSGSARLARHAPFGSPAYEAGLELGDVILSLDGVSIVSREQLDAVLARHAPGDAVSIRFLRRDGGEVTTTLTLTERVATEIVPVEETGRTPSAAQLEFREAWLGSRRR